MENKLRRPVEPANEAPLIDWALLESVMETFGETPGERAAVALLLFEQELGAQLAAVEEAIDRRDLGEVRHAAHRLCGAALQLGAQLLADMGREAERAAEWPTIGERGVRLRACFEATLAAVRERIAAAV